MSDIPEPRWDLLPHDPLHFFDLPEDFDLRDLKRSYNQLVRRFKPEKFPEEFQRIRAAYDELNDARRYNLLNESSTPAPRSPVPSLREEFNSPSSAVSPPAESRREPPTPAIVKMATPVLELRERAASAPARVLYEELKSRAAKSSSDYVALGLLSDVVGLSTPGDSFVEWLFAGLTAEPRDWSLTRLLRSYLADEGLSLEALPSLLLSAVKVLPADRFQYTTERAWDRLLREGTFDQFRNCLEQCGAKLGRGNDQAQLVFYIHLLKPALWKADDSFIDALRSSIDDHVFTLDSAAQRDYEFIAQLLDYRARRSLFVDRGECCKRIDAALRDWCLLPESQGDASVLDCQFFLSLRGQKLLDEFPDHEEDLTFLLLPWERAVADVLDRLSPSPAQDDAALAKQTRDFMIRVIRRTNRSRAFAGGVFLMILAVESFLLAVVAVGSFAIHALIQLLGRGVSLEVFVDGLLLTLSLVIGIAWPVFLYMKGRKLSSAEYPSARRDLIRLLRIAPLRVDDLATVIEAREDEEYDEDLAIKDTAFVTVRMRKDAAIEIFSLAQRCLSAAMPTEIVDATVVLEPAVSPPSRPRPPYRSDRS